MPRTTAFWEKRREAALQLAQEVSHKRVIVLNHIAGLRRKLRRLNQGIHDVSFSRRAWKQPYTKELLVALIGMDLELAARYQARHKKYEKRADYCKTMAKRCREKTLWDKILQKPAF